MCKVSTECLAQRKCSVNGDSSCCRYEPNVTCPVLPPMLEPWRLRQKLSTAVPMRGAPGVLAALDSSCCPVFWDTYSSVPPVSLGHSAHARHLLPHPNNHAPHWPRVDLAPYPCGHPALAALLDTAALLPSPAQAVLSWTPL